MSTVQKSLKVFISYSHDSKEHRSNVRKFADTLRKDYGIDVIGDFYEEDNPSGGQIPDLMEKIRNCDRVVCVVTPQYKIKADEGKGGVGYEKTIITEELFQDIGSSKFIPICIYSNVNFMDCIPNFLTATRKAILINAFESEDLFIEEIARSICDIPKNPKPPLGKNKLLSDKIIINAENINIEEIIDENSYKVIFENSLYYAKNGDEYNFRTLLKKVKRQVFYNIKSLRKQFSNVTCNNKDDFYAMADKFVNAAAPLFLIAFAAQLSFNEKFQNQEGLLIDLLSIEGWDYSGLTSHVNVPQLLAYIYHHIYGALLIDNNRINNIPKILNQKIPIDCNQNYEVLYKVHSVTGWIDSLGKDCFESFNYLLNAYQKWDWIKIIFADEDEYKKSIVCYQSTINLLNYFNVVRDNNFLIEDPYLTKCDVPPSSAIATDTLKNYVHGFLIKNSSFFKDYLNEYKISIESALANWDNWLKEIRRFNTNFKYLSFWLFRQNILKDLLI